MPRQTTLKEKIETLASIKSFEDDDDVFDDSDDSTFEDVAKIVDDDVVFATNNTKAASRVELQTSNIVEKLKPKVKRQIFPDLRSGCSVSGKGSETKDDVFDDSFDFKMSQQNFDDVDAKNGASEFDNFKEEESFDLDFGQMNDSQFQTFTQGPAKVENLPSHSSTPKFVKIVPKAVTPKREDYATAYRDVIESDDSFDFGLSQMAEPGTEAARSTERSREDSTPKKQQKMMTPLLSQKIKSRLNFK